MDTHPTFRVTVDMDRGCFETAMQGFWTLETLADFRRALEDAVARIRATGREPVSLCDYSGAMVQSQEVVAGFIAMMADPAVRSRRVAVYTGAALTRLQAERANRDHAEFRYFVDRDAAVAWLFSPDGA
ncbi:hypothetical protein [Sphingomonas sp. NIC1]|uniref:hypothetical protein n=1 Tax=Sphingomonas sp. NIC1 TaxID=1961362 RepID=UPI0007C0F65C|nr:hypothetical protein [Sphingomonas sp. NIC1]ANC86789.1 hypothetical protein A7E77_07710 [Sphingomonas sp. NIC1]